jgi:hypothetical protein
LLEFYAPQIFPVPKIKVERIALLGLDGDDGDNIPSKVEDNSRRGLGKANGRERGRERGGRGNFGLPEPAAATAGRIVISFEFARSRLERSRRRQSIGLKACKSFQIGGRRTEWEEEKLAREIEKIQSDFASGSVLLQSPQSFLTN